MISCVETGWRDDHGPTNIGAMVKKREHVMHSNTLDEQALKPATIALACGHRSEQSTRPGTSLGTKGWTVNQPSMIWRTRSWIDTTESDVLYIPEL